MKDRPGPIKGPDATIEYVAPKLSRLDREVFFLMCLDAKNRIIHEEVVSIGILTASLVHPREVFRPAIRRSAASIIVAHNHPSGVPDPSAEDLDVTARLIEVGKIVGIHLLDHIIVGERSIALSSRGSPF